MANTIEASLKTFEFKSKESIKNDIYKAIKSFETSILDEWMKN